MVPIRRAGQACLHRKRRLLHRLSRSTSRPSIYRIISNTATGLLSLRNQKFLLSLLQRNPNQFPSLRLSSPKSPSPSKLPLLSKSNPILHLQRTNLPRTTLNSFPILLPLHQLRPLRALLPLHGIHAVAQTLRLHTPHCNRHSPRLFVPQPAVSRLQH